MSLCCRVIGNVVEFIYFFFYYYFFIFCFSPFAHTLLSAFRRYSVKAANLGHPKQLQISELS